jgi:hypothetical protein
VVYFLTAVDSLVRRATLEEVLIDWRGVHSSRYAELRDDRDGESQTHPRISRSCIGRHRVLADWFVRTGRL